MLCGCYSLDPKLWNFPAVLASRMHSRAKDSCFCQSSDSAGAYLHRRMCWAVLCTLTKLKFLCIMAVLLVWPQELTSGWSPLRVTHQMASMGHFGLLTQLSSHLASIPPPEIPQSCCFAQQASAVKNPALAKDRVHETWRSLVVLPKLTGLGCGC